MIKVQNTTNVAWTFDLIPGVCQARIRIDEGVANSLMRSSVVVEITRDADGMSQPTIAHKPKTVQALGFERAEEALDVRIADRRARWDTYDLDPSGPMAFI